MVNLNQLPRRTKIVATLGPASDDREVIDRLIAAGVDVVRLNFSHGSYADHGRRIAMLRTAAAEAKRAVAILQDLQGPKIRTGTLRGGQPVLLVAGSTFTITTRSIEGDGSGVSTGYAALPGDVLPGERILLSDGLIELQVVGVRDDEVETRVVYGGQLREKQGINLPSSVVSAPAITEKDRADVAWGIANGVDYVAMSFVRRAQDVVELRDLIAASGRTIPIVAKIEKPQALQDLDAILHATDAVMVARGDLGVEMAPERVPVVQKELIAAAARHNVTVITATQMLESMIHNARPTRAEASDVANAIFDGSDAVMLSGETANGAYPVEAVEMMARIARTTEESDRYRHQIDALPHLWHPEDRSDPALAIAHAARGIADTLPIAAIVAFTQSGYTARLVASSRPSCPVIALTPSDEIARRVALYWGVQPLLCPWFDQLNQIDSFLREELPRHGIAQPGERVVITGGHPLLERGRTNFVKVLDL
ncbi:MAG: pyruvate kinase [Herpetosiphon sp.]